MSDRYSQLVRLPVAGTVGQAHRAAAARRARARLVVEINGRVLLGGAGRVAEAAARVLRRVGADAATALDDPVREHAAAAGLDAAVFNPEAPADQRFKALVFDATGIDVVGGPRRAAALLLSDGLARAAVGPRHRARRRAARAGGLHALAGKEIGPRGATVNLVHVEEGAEDQIGPTLRFLLSPRSAYVSGQVAHVGPGARGARWRGRTALVTGASRGIGAAIADVLEREGASVVRLDLTDADIELDITAATRRRGSPSASPTGSTSLVHNAGVTKDRTLAKMPEDRWQSLMEVNLLAPERITAALLPLLSDDGRIVCVSSMSAIAGNAGQTNYATSKAGLLDLVARPGAERGITINAVAPGFIETQMTAAMPIGVREAGRRMNSLRQGGLPVDVAETVAWLAGSGRGPQRRPRVRPEPAGGLMLDDRLKAALPGPRRRAARGPARARGHGRPRAPRRTTRTCAASRCATSSRRPTRTCSRSACTWTLLAKAPFSAVGVVHIANRIVQHRPLLLGEDALAARLACSGFEPHRRGRTFDFVTEARVGDELVWEGFVDEPQARRRRRVRPRRAGRSRTRR